MSNPRKKLFQNVVTFPATKSAGAATYYSDSMYPFPDSSGNLNVTLTADDSSKITDTLTTTLQVSFDEGTTWKDAVAYTDLANGTGAIVAYKDAAVAFAPMARIKAVFDGTGALLAGHGIGIDVEFEEQTNLLRTQIDTDNVNVGDTEADEEIVNGTSVEALGTVEKVMAVYTGVASKVTDADVKIQSSFDGSSWWDTGATAAIESVSFKEILSTAKLGKYFRAVITTDAGTGAIIADHLINVDLIIQYI